MNLSRILNTVCVKAWMKYLTGCRDEVAGDRSDPGRGGRCDHPAWRDKDMRLHLITKSKVF